MTPLVFIHGWALGPAVWDPIVDLLPGHECHVLNLGFKGERQITAPPNAIIVGHSMGFAWGLDHLSTPWKYGVCLNGFTKFSRSADFEAGIDLRVLTRMQTRLKTAPDTVVRDFLTRAGVADPDVTGYDLAALSQHLDWLITMDVRAKLAAIDCPVLAISSSQDAIVPQDLTRASFAETAIEWIKGGDHMAPFKNPAPLAARLRSLAAEA